MILLSIFLYIWLSAFQHLNLVQFVTWNRYITQVTLTGAAGFNPNAPKPARSFPNILRRSKKGKSPGPAPNKRPCIYYNILTLSKLNISKNLNWDGIINSLPTVHAHDMQYVKYLQEQGAAVLPKEHNEENWDLPTPAHPSAHCLSATACAKYLVLGLKHLWTQSAWSHSPSRYVGVIYLLFFARHLYLIGVRFGEIKEQTPQSTCSK